jgi:predicted O-methyltransferase YrrM
LSLEIAPKIAALAKKQVEVNGVAEWAQVITADSKQFLRGTRLTFDFAFFDSLLENRCEELRICLERKLLIPGSFFAIHDTSKLRVTHPGKPDPVTAEHWKEFETISGIKWLQFPLSRGMTLGQVL